MNSANGAGANIGGRYLLQNGPASSNPGTQIAAKIHELRPAINNRPIRLLRESNRFAHIEITGGTSIFGHAKPASKDRRAEWIDRIGCEHDIDTSQILRHWTKFEHVHCHIFIL